MTELFSNEFFQLSLEDLKWEHAESKTHAWETIRISTLEDKSIFFAIMLRALTKPLKLGDYTYRKTGIDRLERESPKIKKKRKENKLFTVSQIFKRQIKPQPEPGKGVVIEPEPVKVFD